MVPLMEPCALRSTQPLKVSTRDFSWGKGGRCIMLMTHHPCNAETSRKSRALTYLEPLGPPRPVAGDLLHLCTPNKFPSIYFENNSVYIQRDNTRRHNQQHVCGKAEMNEASHLTELHTTLVLQLSLPVLSALDWLSALFHAEE